MHFLIKTRPECSFCTRAKDLLKAHGHSYTEERYASPAQIENFKSQGYTTFPQVFREGLEFEHIGGYDALLAYLGPADSDDF